MQYKVIREKVTRKILGLGPVNSGFDMPVDVRTQDISIEEQESAWTEFQAQEAAVSRKTLEERIAALEAQLAAR